MDISPIESLLVVFAYKKCMEETVSVEDIKEGTLGLKLTQEDFDTALQVNFTYSAMFSMKNEVIMCNSCLT